MAQDYHGANRGAPGSREKNAGIAVFQSCHDQERLTFILLPLLQSLDGALHVGLDVCDLLQGNQRVPFSLRLGCAYFDILGVQDELWRRRPRPPRPPISPSVLRVYLVARGRRSLPVDPFVDAT